MSAHTRIGQLVLIFHSCDNVFNFTLRPLSLVIMIGQKMQTEIIL